MKVTGMNRTTEQRNLLRIYSIDKKENGICLQICSNKTEEKIEESQKKGDSDMAEFDYEVVNGRKIRVRPVETVSEVDENGYFVRQPNHFTEGFGEGKNPVEAGRYRLVWAKLCHWSNRASIVEMTAAGKIIAGRTYRYFEVYVSLAVIYWIITIIVEQGIKLIEKKIRIPENAPAIQTDEGALNQ